VNALVSLPTWFLAAGWLLFCGGFAAAARWLFRRYLPEEQRAGASSVAGPLMPALGALFALLAALSLAGEAAATRSAESDVSLEAAAASRLAWASTNPGLDADEIQRALLGYLEATRSQEWPPDDEGGDQAALVALAELEGQVRDAAATDGLGSAQAGELLGSIGSLTSLRRQRLATAAQPLPDFYVAVVVLSGLALIANSAALALSAWRRVAFLTSGLVVVVGLAVALLFALSAPFSGGFVADDSPLGDVISDLEAGLFQP
jgi:hypothetical protein